jgi:Fic family protein
MYFTEENISTFAKGLFNLFNKIMEDGAEKSQAISTKPETATEQLFKKYENKISEEQVKSTKEINENFRDAARPTQVSAHTKLVELQLKLKDLSKYRTAKNHGALVDTLDILELLLQNKFNNRAKNIQVLGEIWGISKSAVLYRLRKVKKLGYIHICGKPRVGTNIELRQTL